MSTPNLVTTLEEGSVCFLDHLIRTVGDDAAGRTTTSVDVNPDGLFWLGRLATESSVAANKYGDRGERLDPCAIGVTVRLAPAPNWTATIRMSAVIWHRPDSKVPWTKTILRPPATTVSFGPGISTLATWLALHDDAAGPAHSARVDVEVITGLDHSSECTISLVNDSAGESSSCFDANLYEVVLEVDHLATVPFELDALPDSFRYDRRVNSYGINCGVEPTESGLRTADLVVVDVSRPAYWSSNIPEPDLTFSTLAVDPLPSCDALITAYQTWRRSAWGQATLATRALEERWSDEMIAEATLASGEVTIEAKRIENGLELLAANETLLAAFRLMNEAMVLATARKSFKGWRPFQLGFLLANLNCIANPVEEADTADIVWFATGGGKTETYLGLLLTAAFHDRMTGKASGTTAWSRFPLRMLSLQQTQRFADAMAAAELVRQRHGIPGDPFSVGFLVGSGATPNRIKLEPDIPSDPNVDDDDMPAKYRVLTKCPFCAADTATHFDRVRWTLEHACTDDRCPWGANPLPFYIVDEEIFRFLPTIVVGTVDKVALVAMQASMRGLIGAPHGRCDREGHGYTYATRAARKNGCLVPGCKGSSTPLSHEESTRIAPSFRLQDELHLLRDSLGAVDSHYEGLLDHLLQEIAGRRSKILASSATLAGYQRQIEVVYQRAARVFPNPPPSERQGFWTTQTDRLARRFVAVAPGGATLEFAIDKLLSSLQQMIRDLIADPARTIEFGVDPALAADLVDLYGVDVVYGNTLRDLDALIRSTETQLRVQGVVNTATLTGGTDFEEVRRTLDRLDSPEEAFEDRVHIIAASAMMSHGVDIDRLNVMAVYGIPLATAEFIQATARVGRRHPAVVFVLHKIARERDASVYRNFEPFVRQGDRFVEPIPVTRHSRRVLDRTLPGLALARLLQVVEPGAGRSLATVRSLATCLADGEYDPKQEATALVAALGFDREVDGALRQVIEKWMTAFRLNIQFPPPGARFPNELAPGGRPMLSLRDVEAQIPVIGLVKS